jgi:hypothetical protein
VLLRLATDSTVRAKLNSGRHVALYAGLLASNGVGLAIINSPSIAEAGKVAEKSWKANGDIFKEALYAELFSINGMI